MTVYELILQEWSNGRRCVLIRKSWAQGHRFVVDKTDPDVDVWSQREGPYFGNPDVYGWFYPRDGGKPNYCLLLSPGTHGYHLVR